MADRTGPDRDETLCRRQSDEDKLPRIPGAKTTNEFRLIGRRRCGRCLRSDQFVIRTASPPWVAAVFEPFDTRSELPAAAAGSRPLAAAAAASAAPRHHLGLFITA